MNQPPLLVHYSTIEEYRRHFELKYCRKPILAFDNIPVYFSKKRFNHAFFESSIIEKAKDNFSTIRAERIDWIKATLENPNTEMYCGWNKKRKRYDPRRRVGSLFDDFIVVTYIGWKQNGTLKGEFITAYVADNSINKIRNAPKWNREMLKRKNR